VAWRNPVTPAISPVGVLRAAGGAFSFSYVLDAVTIPGFRPMIEFPDVNVVYRSPTLFPFFAQRVMDPKRPDYESYIRALALPEDADELDVLGRSGGRRQSDTYQVIEAPRVDAGGRTSFDFLVHGVRFAPSGLDPDLLNEELDRLRTGDRLALLAEPDNPVNERAQLVVTAAGLPLGWIPDLLLPYVDHVMSSGGDLSVLRVNSADTAWQLRLVVHLEGEIKNAGLTFEGGPWRTFEDDLDER
jgi:hypothetical protein